MRILVRFFVLVSLLVQCGSLHAMAQSQGPAGPQGPPSPIGPGGPQGATGRQGAVGLTGTTGGTGAVGSQGPLPPASPQSIAGQGFRDPYVAGNSYNAYALTTEGGSTYTALQANQNVDPATNVTNAEGHCALEALARAQGQTRPAGPQGPIGFPGASGALGPQGLRALHSPKRCYPGYGPAEQASQNGPAIFLFRGRVLSSTGARGNFPCQ